MDIQRTAEYWDRWHLTTEHHRAEWTCHPFVLERLHRDILGANSPEEWFINTYIKGRRLSRAMGVGVGTGGMEIRMLAHGAVEQFDLYEISQASLDRAREDARILNVEHRARYICEDFTRVSLEPNSYDLVTFSASLHHMDPLDRTLEAVFAALKPGGMLFAFEYVGPNRFNYPKEHTVIAERLYDVLDPSLKRWPSIPLTWPKPEEVIAADPTEAAHSEEIPATLRRIFPRLDVKHTYGSLCFILFWGLNPDAIYETEKGRDLIRLVLELETALVESGRLPSYFDCMVAFKPPLPE